MNNGPIPLLSPRQQFQQNAAFLHAHREFVGSDAFSRSINAALLQQQIEWGQQVKDQGTAMMVGIKIQAVQEFLMTLKTLAEVPKLSVTRPNDNLVIQS
jgi:hypothetical protein